MAVRRPHLALAVALVGVLTSASARPATPPGRVRVAFVPADDRAVSLQEIVLMGTLADADVVTPPRSRLGRGDLEGDADGIAEWLDALDVSALDAVIVDVDTLAYGGVPASRRLDATVEKARGRVQAIGRLKARRKDLRVYAFASLLGIEASDEGHKGAWRTTLARWAELGGSSAADPAAAAQAKALEDQIPTTMLDRYRALRARNRVVTADLVDLLRRGALDYLVLMTPNEPPRGVTADERAGFDAALSASLAAHRAIFVPEGDEIATLLVARALAAPGRHVDVQVLSAKGETAARLSAEIGDGLQIAGLTPTARPGPEDLTCIVYAGRDDGAAAAAAAEKASKLLAAGRRVSVADVADAPADGASLPLVEGLRIRHAFQRLSGYAAGSRRLALARAIAAGALLRSTPPGRAAREQVLLHRLAVDFAYFAVVRPQAIDDYLQPHHIDPARLDADQKQRTEAYLVEQVKPLVENLISDVGEPLKRPVKPGPSVVRDVNDFKLTLPTGRLDEVEISFTLTAG